MNQSFAGTFKLTLAIVIADVLLLLILFAIIPLVGGTKDWFYDFSFFCVLVLGYRVGSLQPLYLYLMLSLFRQRLGKFSRLLVMALSSVSSLISLLAIKMLFSGGMLPPAEWVPAAFEFIKNALFKSQGSMIILSMLGVLLLSPLLVYQARRLLVCDVE